MLKFTDPGAGHNVPVVIAYRDVVEEPAWFLEMLKGDMFDILLDPGTLTVDGVRHAVVDVDAYIRFVQKWKGKLWGYFVMGVADDAARTFSGLKRMWNAGLSPIPVHTAGEGKALLDDLFARSALVAFVGVVRRTHATLATMQYLGQRMRWAGGRPIHIIGLGRDECIRKLGPRSVCAGEWGRAIRKGVLGIYVGCGNWLEVYSPSRVRAGMPALTKDGMGWRQMQRQLAMFGVSPECLTDPANWQEGGVARLVHFYSWIQYVHEFKARWGTTIFLTGVRGAGDVMALARVRRMVGG